MKSQSVDHSLIGFISVLGVLCAGCVVEAEGPVTGSDPGAVLGEEGSEAESHEVAADEEEARERVGEADGTLCTPTASSISPISLSLGQETTFTVYGSCLPSSTALYIPECEGMTDANVSWGGSYASFTCTPSWTRGPKHGVVKDQSGGIVLLPVTVNVF